MNPYFRAMFTGKNLIIGLLFLAACGVSTPKFAPQPSPDQDGRHTPVDRGNPHNCDLVEEVVQLVHGDQSLPSEGIFIEESHLATSEDLFSKQRLFPIDVLENIDLHLARACNLLQSNHFPQLQLGECANVYADQWDREWTPPESGQAGQGSVGNLRPTPVQEMWSGNMYWTAASKPRPGEKFLATFNGINIVVAMGFETGPGSRRFLGGLQPEIFWALGAKNHESTIKLGRLIDQSLDYGPVRCVSNRQNKDQNP